MSPEKLGRSSGSDAPGPRPTVRSMDYGKTESVSWHPTEAGEKLDLHALRHSAATQWARRGVPIVHAQALLGHSDVRLTSRVYTRVAIEDLRGAVE